MYLHSRVIDKESVLKILEIEVNDDIIQELFLP